MINYKSIIKSQNLRLKLLRLMEFIPDKLMIKIQYRIKTGKKLNLENPVRFNEKLQWYKLFYRDPLMTDCTDKFKDRNYVREKGLNNILIPLYGVYDNAEEIKLEKLPKEFVIKTNNGGGSTTNIICTDKNNIAEKKLKKQVNSWLNKRTATPGREWSYYNIKPKIISEKFIKSNSEHGLIDYKFYCFDGKPSYLKVATDSASDRGPKNSFFDCEFNELDYKRESVDQIKPNLTKPKNFDEMCRVASKLSEDFPHVRVDLYNIEGKIYFGELTFYDNSGYQIVKPDDFDFVLGKLFQTKVIKL